jgi:RNA-directed DNA polymerase
MQSSFFFYYYKTQYRTYRGTQYKVTDKLILHIYTYLYKYVNIKYPYQLLFFGKHIEELFHMYNQLLHDYPGFSQDKAILYHDMIRIPKKKRYIANGKLETKYREIIEPNPPLKKIQRQMLAVLRDIMSIKPHASAMAYEKETSIVDNALFHKDSNHFVRIDLSDFFGSINPNFFRSVLTKYYEFGLLQLHDYYLADKNPFMIEELRGRFERLIDQSNRIVDILIDIAFLDNKLPQGSPLSPYLSNLAMMEVDYNIAEALLDGDYSNNQIRYTRYADDMVFSSFSSINKIQLVKMVKAYLASTPLKVNDAKTGYYKLPAKVQITGLTVSNDHQVTYGHLNKAQLKRELFILMINIKNGNFDLEVSQKILGKLSYLAMIEPTYYQRIRYVYSQKFNLEYESFNSYLLNGQE